MKLVNVITPNVLEFVVITLNVRVGVVITLNADNEIIIGWVLITHDKLYHGM